jgi:TolA-binding protein
MLSKNKIILIGFICMASLLYANEPSVYGAGDINSASPYGLTKTEQAVLENKKTLQMLYNRMTEQQRKIDCLTTVIEGQNREILELKEQLAISQQSTTSSMDDNGTYSMLLELGQTIDHINNTYVSRDELKKVLAGSRPSSSLGSPVGSNSADTYRKGVQLFGKRSYGAAKARFEQTVAITINQQPQITT